MNFFKSIPCFISLFLCAQSQANIQSYFEQIKNDPSALYEFFQKMPKGGELHYHLAGGPYPETLLTLAAQNNYCLDKKTFTLSKSMPCSGINTKELQTQPELYGKTVKSWSMKDFIPGVESGHDHFFNAFLKFIPLVDDHGPSLIANVVQRAANQEEHYLELLILPDNGKSTSFGSLLKDNLSFAQKRKRLLANKEFQNNIHETIAASEYLLNETRKKLGCQTAPQAKNCQIKIKFLYYSLREQPLNNLFAQTLNAFEAVAQSQNQDGTLVGVNLVQPEDGIISLRDYHKQMQIYQYLHQMYPHVNIALHAGELSQEQVTSEELNYHIYDALFTGKAQRIGHGVDIAHEHDATHILNYMAKQHLPVEINLISNLRLLNVSGRNHPLNYYLAHHVPVVLSTDDEGMLRTNLTTQYVTAVLNHGLSYSAIKQINRNALTYAFLPGKSIWADSDKAQKVPECQELSSLRCHTFIKNNEKAELQSNLEHALNAFEGKY